MTTLQIKACRLIEQLPEAKLVEVINILNKFVSDVKSNTDSFAEQETERKKRLAALEELRKTREELIAMNIDWNTELREAFKEKYGV
ncbi:MAG: hypothetical protein IJS15_14625 [Victivallales bacterium]|nr:hypothetical protein [Victivallales bacterium]